jgi:hypothetical protein
MEWYKHSTGSHDDPDISDAWDELGDFGYVGFFVILEIYGQEFSHRNSEDFIMISKTFLRRKLRKSWGKVQLLLDFYQSKLSTSPKNNILEPRISHKVNGTYILIKVPKFIELASNWSKRSPTEAPTETPTPHARGIEVEVEVEVEKIKDLKTHTSSKIDDGARKNHIKKASIIPEYSQSFLEFWELYPRKVGKTAANNSWREIGVTKKVTTKTIIDALLSQNQAGMFDLSDKMTHCPHPSTWLNNRRWEDEIIKGDLYGNRTGSSRGKTRVHTGDGTPDPDDTPR